MKRTKQHNKEGVALLIALLFVILLSVVVIEYAFEAEVDAAFVGNTMDDLQACIAARSAVATAFSLLAADLQLAGATLPGDPGGAATYTSFLGPWSPIDENGALRVQVEPINDAHLSWFIEDEGGKLNLNALIDYETDEENEILVEVLRALFEVLEAPEDPVDAILDWLDEMDDPRPNGAEDMDYDSLTVPYVAKNGPMDSIEELLLIRGITPELYFGNPNVDPPLPPLPALLTVHGNTTGKININTARFELLDALY